jgi:hypothetical protein
VRMSLMAPRRWIALVLVAFAINVAWEFAQAGLYGGRPPWWVYVEAAVKDGLIITAAAAFALAIARLWRRAFWPAFLLALVATAAFIELRALVPGSLVLRRVDAHGVHHRPLAVDPAAPHGHAGRADRVAHHDADDSSSAGAPALRRRSARSIRGAPTASTMSPPTAARNSGEVGSSSVLPRAT